MKPATEGMRAPELPGTRWINSAPLKVADLKGRVLLVDFWGYTCGNSLRSLPYTVAWHERYAALGLVVLGVHAPEFPFAREIENVERSVSALGISYPVALDNDFHAWHAFHNHYWPAKYLFDAGGMLRYFHFGEGDYEGCERAIQECLAEVHPQRAWPEPMPPLRPEDRPGAVCFRVTPALYLGLERDRLGNAEPTGAGEARTFELPGRRDPDRVYAEGLWQTELKHVESVGDGRAALHLRYSAREVDMVLAAAEPVDLEVTQDGQPLVHRDRGEDGGEAVSGATVVRVREPRLYRVVSNAEHGTHDLRVGVDRPGLRAYAVSFVASLDPSAAAEAAPDPEAGEVRGTRAS